MTLVYRDLSPDIHEDVPPETWADIDGGKAVDLMIDHLGYDPGDVGLLRLAQLGAAKPAPPLDQEDRELLEHIAPGLMKRLDVHEQRTGDRF